MSGITTPGDVGHPSSGGGHGHGGNHFDPNPWGWKPKGAQLKLTAAEYNQFVADQHIGKASTPAEQAFLQRWGHGPGQQGGSGGGGGGSISGGGNGHPENGSNQPGNVTGGGSGKGTVQDIIDFFRGKGLNDVAIAAILGNWRVESDLDPTRPNPGEGAIGLGQWEGGRRTALQQFAAARGLHETDLQAQLEYTWHELTTGYTGVLQQLRGATNVYDAANVWNRQYEVSGDYTNNREQYAQSFLSSGFKNIAGMSVNSGGSSGGFGGGGGGGGSDPAALTAAMNGIAEGLSSVPQLQSILQQAISEGWTPERLQQAVTDSQWYKNHSATARSIIAQQLSDPKTYQQHLQQTVDSITSIANQDGWDLTPAQAQAIAHTALMTGNDANTNWLTQQIGHRQYYGNLKDADSLQGGMASTANQLQQIASQYGYNYTDPARVAHQAKLVLEGVQTIDTYTNQMKEYAKSAFPGLSHQIDQGQTVLDVAQPYLSSMSQLLEVSPGKLNLNTPLVRQALQGVQGQSAEKNSVPTVQPLWQFEQQVRKDPRWAMTDNAHAAASTMLLNLGHEWGFSA